jgi:hypothetical protein
LAGDLEDHRPEGIERREFVHPRSRTEVLARVDDPSEDGIGLPEDLARTRISDRRPRPRLPSDVPCASTR